MNQQVSNHKSRLGGVMASVLAIIRMVRGLKLDQGDEFLREIKTGDEVNPEAPCRKMICQRTLQSMKEIIRKGN
jgi:hypothetical protein